MSDSEAIVSIRRDGTIHVSRAAITQFGPTGTDYVYLYRMRGGGGTRPLLDRERRELGVRAPSPLAQRAEDDALEFM